MSKLSISYFACLSSPLCFLQSRKLKGKIIFLLSETKVICKALLFTAVMLRISRLRVTFLVPGLDTILEVTFLFLDSVAQPDTWRSPSN